MTNNLVIFTTYTFAMVICTFPSFGQQFKTSLHKRHNDDMYADSAEDQPPKKYLENSKLLVRRFNEEPEKNIDSFDELKPINQPCEVTLFKEIEDVLVLLKRILLQGSKFAKALSENILVKDAEEIFNVRNLENPYTTVTSAEEDNDEE